MKPLSPACVFLTGMLIASSAQAADAEITIRVMDIDESSSDAVMQVITLPDETQLRQTQQQHNTDTEQTQLQLREMEMQQMEIEAQHNQPMDQGNNPMQAPDIRDSSLGQGR